MLEKSFLWTTFEKWLFYISDQINYYKEHGLKSGPEKISPWVSHLGKNSEGWQRATHMLETNKSHYSIIIQPIEQISHEILLLLVISSLKKQDPRMKKQRKVGPGRKQIRLHMDSIWSSPLSMRPLYVSLAATQFSDTRISTLNCLYNCLLQVCNLKEYLSFAAPNPY